MVGYLNVCMAVNEMYKFELPKGGSMRFYINPEKAIANVGSLHPLKKVMKRASQGEDINVGFIGGSITQGSLSSTPKTCYSYLVYEWWRKKYNQAKITYINAGIGGTTSQFGVARVQSDLLRYFPDFIIVEFSVNDQDNEHFLETFEGLIRKIMYNEKEPAIIILNNVRYDDGRNAEKMHNRVGKAYQIPCISMQSSIYPKVALKEIDKKDITPDDLHPNDLGHELIASIVTDFLENVSCSLEEGLSDEYSSFNQEEMKLDCKVPPLTRNAYENSVRYQNSSQVYQSYGFKEDTSVQENITQFFKNGWTAGKVGDRIVFMVEGTEISVQYRKSVHKPTPMAVAIIDDNINNAILLDGNYEEDWGDCLYLQTLIKHSEYKVHKIEIEIVETHEYDKVPFYLVSVIGSY